MIKRINLLLAAAAVIAVAIPATAGASTGLTNSKGFPLAVGAGFVGQQAGPFLI